MNLLQRLIKNRRERQVLKLVQEKMDEAKAEIVESLTIDMQHTQTVELEDFSDIRNLPPTSATPTPPRKRRRGRVTHAGKHAAFDVTRRRHGGGVVHTMPRSLKKIKEAQERPVDEM